MLICFFIYSKLCGNHGVAEERQCVLDCGGFLEGVGCIGGCVGSSALRRLMMSCSYISQVAVVMRIVMNAEFL